MSEMIVQVCATSDVTDEAVFPLVDAFNRDVFVRVLPYEMLEPALCFQSSRVNTVACLEPV